ncbi:ammonium transporter [Oryzibacter oryziterrae]|uniref:ammonium transporter n=1 Tax=Oryzibacter oryziterrae TaxID=2766474 RepID=UPI001F22AC47|nr:ammonium transporter [Oryzibacter oryziterrae]
MTFPIATFRPLTCISASGLLLVASLSPAWAQTSTINAADTGFVFMATALVLMMTLPGLALFYSGMVREKNILATMAQSAAATAIVSLLWFAAAYSLSFTGTGDFLGASDRIGLAGMGIDSVNPLAPTIPEVLFMAYQMTFAVITVALVGGAVADRMSFSAFVVFGVIWLFLVYVPSAHMVWGGGWLARMGVIDFAGGTVVHINAGVGGLVAALVIGPRLGFGKENMAPSNLSLAVVGTGLLWVGWFGFNGGSALAIGPRAVYAVLSTHLAACAGAVVWSLIEYLERGKPSVLGIISGAVAGLGTITPASGFVEPWHGVVIGAVAGAVCYLACTRIKTRFGYDDSLDVFGVHGVGGILGTLAAGVFASAGVSASAGGPGISGLIEGNGHQLAVQFIGVGVTIAWAAVGTWVALKLTGLLTSLRVSAASEREGLDLALHGEAIK